MKWRTACATALLLANGNPDAVRAATAPAAATAPPPTAAAVCASLPSTDAMLPCGMFHTAGSQVVDQMNRPVRLSCMAVEMDPTWGKVPLLAQFLTLVLMGRNCIRTSINNDILQKNWDFIDTLVAAAKAVSIRVIIDHHLDDEGCPGGQQGNGLWFDSGPGSDGTDGCKDIGHVTDASFTADWVATAKRYKGNDTVIGYDLDNEPQEWASVWGGGGPKDIHAMYERVGNAILAVDPSKLIIAEGPQSYPDQPEGDLTHVATMPVSLTVPNHVVYSVHEYPKETAGIDSCGPSFVQRMNNAWGYLITKDIAPVWIGEMATQFNAPNTDDDKCWATTLADYVNGKSPGGLVIPKGGQGPGTDWWWWDYGRPYGVVVDGSMTKAFADQGALIASIGQAPIGGALAASASTPAAYGQVLGAISGTVAPSAPDQSLAVDQPAAAAPASTTATPVGGAPYELPAPTVATPAAPAVTLVSTPPSLAGATAPAQPAAPASPSYQVAAASGSGTTQTGAAADAAAPFASSPSVSVQTPAASTPANTPVPTVASAAAPVAAGEVADTEARIEAAIEALTPEQQADVMRTVRRYRHLRHRQASSSAF